MYTIARPIGETTLNGTEYLLNQDGSLMKFNSIEEAKMFLKTNGFDNITDEDLDDIFIFDIIDDKCEVVQQNDIA